MNVKRLIPVVILLCGLGLAFAFDLHTYLTLSSLKTHREMLGGYTASHLPLSVMIFILVYIAVVAFSLPGGAIMTLTSGFLFGTWLGGTTAVIGATVGATLLFLAAKYALGGFLRARAGPWLQKMEKGFQDNALSYMMVLRLVPLFPFFIVNLVPAFMAVRTRDYVLTTFFGIMPATFVYAGIGSGLGALLEKGEEPNLAVILSPEILGPLLGLSVLALVPVFYKKWKRV